MTLSFYPSSEGRGFFLPYPYRILNHELFLKWKIIALTISNCIRFYFHAIIIDHEGKMLLNKIEKAEGNVVIDGSILADYYIHLFDY
jgi:hypothetical protein